jgi:hypothetical protein
MRDNRHVTESLSVRAELVDLGVYQIACERPLSSRCESVCCILVRECDAWLTVDHRK